MNIADRVEALRVLGWEKIRQNEPAEAIERFDEALAIVEDESQAELITIYKAFALVADGRTDGEVLQLPRIVMRRRTPRHLFLAAYSLMYRFRLDQEFERAGFYGRLALEASEAVTDENWKPIVLTELGNVAVFDSRFNEAVAYYDEAIGLLGDTPEDAYKRAFMKQNIGYCQLLLDNHETGIDLIHEAIRALKESGGEGFVAESYIDLCLGYLETDEYDKARHYGELGLELAKEDRQVRNAHYLLGEVAHKSGDIDKAVEHFDHLATYYPDFPHLKDLLLAIDLRSMVNLKLS